jgi:hypothetical protein
MNKRKLLFVIAISAAAVIGLGFWRWSAARSATAAHFVIVKDPSKSVVTDDNCTISLARLALTSPSVRKGSTLTVTATGDAASANEPRMIATYDVPMNRRVLEGRGAEETKREQLLTDLAAKCKNVTKTETSPIYLGIKRAIEHLRACGCGEMSNCVVYVQSDLEENADRQIKQALDGNKVTSRPVPSNNDGIDVAVIGVAQTLGFDKATNSTARHLTPQHDQKRADRIVQVWRNLFTSPSRLTFEPYCPEN